MPTLSVRTKTRHVRLMTASVMTIALVGGTTAAWAAEEATPPADAESGMVVVKDKATGELRAPTAAEAAELARLSAKDRKLQRQATIPGTQAATVPPGTQSAVLGEEHMNYEVAHVGPDGKVTFECVHGAKAAKQSATRPPEALETE